MQRSDLIHSILTPVIARIPILERLFNYTHPCVRSEFDQEKFFGYVFIPVTAIVIVLSFLQERRHLRKNLWKGRPGLPWPINFLEDTENRLLYVAAFSMTCWTVWDVLQGDVPFKWVANGFMANLARLSACLMSALISYPIFGAIASDHAVAFGLGSIYTVMYAVVYMKANYPCSNHSVEWTIQLAQLIPIVIAMCFVFVNLTMSCFTRTLAYLGYDGWYQKKKKIAFESSPAYLHVAQLLAANRPHGALIRKRMMATSEQLIYKNIPTFRYSLSILVGVTVSIQFIYVGCLDIMKVEQYWASSLRRAYYANKDPPDAVILNDTMFGFSLPIQLSLANTNHSNDRGVKYGDDFLYWLNAIEISSYFSTSLAFFSTTIAILFTLRSYRRDLLYSYAGKRLALMPNLRHLSLTQVVANGAKYVGFQFGNAVGGFVMQAFLLFIVCNFLTVILLLMFKYNKCEPILRFLFNIFGPVTTYFCGLFVVQWVLVRYCFLQRNEHGRLVLAFDNRRLLWNFQYFMVFANSTLGFVSCLVRITKTYFFGAWSLPRLDVSIMNRHFERYDNGYCAYMGLLAMESCHSNPALIVFTQLLQQSTTTDILNETTFDNPLSNDAYEYEKLKSRSKVLRNRWYLYVTLHHNPGLRLFRKEAVRVQRLIQAEEVLLDDALIDSPRLRMVVKH